MTSRWWRTRREAVALLVVIGGLLFLSACTTSVTPVETAPGSGGTSIERSPLAMASDHGAILNEIPWCDDPHGNSAAQLWPCQWDRRESAAPGWDPAVSQIAIFVRAVDGCPDAIDTSNQPWSCYWRPQDQAGATP